MNAEEWHPRELLTPSEWELVYPVHADPIGRVRREGDGFRAWCGEEDLGVFESGDAAAEAVWERFLEASSTRHEAASITHGGHDRHQGREPR